MTTKCLIMCAAMLLTGRVGICCSSTGFNIHFTEDVHYVDGSVVRGNPASYQAYNASKQADLANAQGTTTYFSGQADYSGHASSATARVPAIWLIKWTSGPCNGQSRTISIPYGGAIVIADCQIYNVRIFALSPTSWYSNQNPDMTETGSGITTTYGEPWVNMTDLSGNQYGLDMNTGGSTGSVICYGMTGVAGNYWAIVMNKNADGTTTAVGGARYNILKCSPSPCQ